MQKRLGNSARGCSLTGEVAIENDKTRKISGFDSDSTSMPISSDTENEEEAASNAASFKYVSQVSSKNTSILMAESNGTKNIDSDKKDESDKGTFSIRTDRRLICAIGVKLKESLLLSLGDSQIVQLAVRFVSESYDANRGDELTQNIIAESEKLQDKKNDTVTFRVSDEIGNKIKKIYQTESFTFAVKCCLIVFHNLIFSNGVLSRSITESLSSYGENELGSCEYLFFRFGLKNGKLLDLVIQSIEGMQSGCTAYIEPFTGTANILLHLKTKFETEEINDGERYLINLLLIIKNYVNEFITELLHYPASKVIFNRFKEEINNMNNEDKSNPGKKSNISDAVKYFYIVLLSCYGKGGSFRTSANNETIFSKFIIILKMSKRLEKVTITNNDAFYLLDKILKRTKEDLRKTIIYFDPPYIGTEGCYKVHGNEMKKKILKASFHKKLNKKILSLRDKGAKIVISYRATVTQKNRYGLTNDGVQEILNHLYMKKGFFIQFVNVPHTSKIDGKYEPDDQIEILLTSEQVSGSIPYDSNIADLIKKYVK